MKTKNKKLFALLMLPAVIAMIVLPLCSFTTTTNPDYESYEPIIRKDVGYVYKTSSNTYYGSISNYNKVLVPMGESLTVSNIKMNASSYLIITSPSMRINYSAFGSGSSIYLEDGKDMLKLQMICSGGNDTNDLYFNGVVDYYGFINLDTALNDYVYFTGSSTKYFRYVGYCEYVNYDSSGNIVASYLEFDYRADSDDGVLPLTHLVECIYRDIPSVDDGRLYINHIQCQYYNLSSVDANWYPIESETFSISNPMYLSPVREAMMMDLIDEVLGIYIYRDVYDQVYREGFNAGVSSVTDWSSLGEFLKNTTSAFFNFEFFDGFNIGSILSIFVSAMLLIAFLKLFAGG